MESDLFLKYSKLNAEIAKLEAGIVERKAQRSAIVQEVSSTLGNGPFTVDGVEVTVSHKGTSFFFKASRKGMKNGPRKAKTQEANVVEVEATLTGKSVATNGSVQAQV